VALNWIWVILVVAVALGFVIFVHELGHFLVAKLCGVKVEKFYLGFDIGGWKLCKFRRGETEYGIGVFPVGGYVKMLGQEDNPNRLREEIQRAKLQQPAENASAETSPGNSPVNPSAESFDLAEAEKALYDPRSYLAKSVPQRMAIISAGVIMNVIFAFFMAVGAYYIGVEHLVCAVGDVLPGEAAWRVGMRPGDAVEEIAGHKTEQFTDFQKYVTVGDIDNGVSMIIKRPGVHELLKFLLHPDTIRGRPTIGVLNSRILTLNKKDAPVLPGSAAARAAPPLHKGDRIVGVDGKTVNNYQTLNAYLSEHPGKHCQLMVACSTSAEDKNNDAPKITKLVDVALPPQPMRSLGLVMTMGEIVAIQDGSPAAEAGVKPRDRIIKIDGRAVEDPMFLPEQLRRRAGKQITVTIERKGSDPLDIPIMLRHVDWYELPRIENNPLSIPELGIAYQVLNKVDRIVAGSVAEKKGIKPGEVIKSAKIVPPDSDAIKEDIGQSKATIEFDEKNQNWPFFFNVLQVVHPESSVELIIDKDKKVILKMENIPDWFYPDRGLIFEPDVFVVKAQSLGQAITLGAENTWESLTLVVRILQKLGSQISMTQLSGPISIVKYTGMAAQRGTADLLLFLTMLSANLAVLNLLPIPVLDGGHLVFLAYEGIRGKPADERVQIGLSMLGLIFLLGLMIFVTGMDILHLFF
jgi:regulator of sigma E protease